MDYKLTSTNLEIRLANGQCNANKICTDWDLHKTAELKRPLILHIIKIVLSLGQCNIFDYVHACYALQTVKFGFLWYLVMNSAS